MKILRARTLFPLLLLLMIAALYGQFLSNPAVFDDVRFFTPDKYGKLPVANMLWSPFQLRSLPYATLTWTYQHFGQDMVYLRLGNLLLHAAVTVTLFFFLARLFKEVSAGTERSCLGPDALALCAAILFAIHPVGTYAVGYLIQRTIVMSTLFSLLAMLSYLNGSKNKLWLWATVPFYYLAVFSKEHAIMLPAVLVALTILLHEDWKARLKKNWPLFGVLLLIALCVVAISKGRLGTIYEIYAPEMLAKYAPEMLAKDEVALSYPLSILTQSWLFIKYVGLWLFPNPAWMSVDMREPFAHSFFSVYLLSFFAFVAWGGAAAWLLFRRGTVGLLGFSMIFPWIMFMTEFSTVRIQEIFVLYRSYIWAVGACAVAPLLIGKISKQVAGIIVAAIIIASFPLSMDRLASFSHPLLLWNDAAKLVKDRPDLPGAYRIYYNRGSEFLKFGDYERAIKDLTLASDLNPTWPFSYNNLGAAYEKNKEWKMAAEMFGKAINIADSQHMGFNPKPYLGRAEAYEKLGERELAHRDYKVTCKAVGMGCGKLSDN